MTILKDIDAEWDTFDDLNEDIERVRVGMRRGLLGTGRSKLAHAHYQWALEHLRAGDIDKADADVRMALHINPRFLDAIHLRERLMGQRTWHAEGSRMRGFVRKLIRSDAGLDPDTMNDRPNVNQILEKALQRAAELDKPMQMCDGLDHNLPKEFETIVANCLAHACRKDTLDHFVSPRRDTFQLVSRRSRMVH